MSEVKHNKLKTANYFFNLLWIVGVIFSIGVVGIYIASSNNIFRHFISEFFRQIPYVGGLLLSYIKSMNIIDIDFFANNIFRPILGIDAIYFALTFLTFQVVIIFLKKYVVKHNNAVLSSLISILLMVTLLLRVKYNLPIAHTTAIEITKSLMNILRLYLVIELILFIIILTHLSKEGKYDIKSIWTREQSTIYTQNGLKLSIAIFTVVSIGLFSAQTLINTAKEEFHIAYQIEFIPGENNKLTLKVPQEISRPLALAGIKLPEEIDENSVLNQFGIDSVDIGSIVNNAVDGGIDTLTYRFVQRPLGKALSGLFISIIIILESIIVQKKKYNSMLVQLGETILLAYLFLAIGTSIGNIISVVTGLTLIGSLNNTFIHLKEGHYYSKTKAKIHELKTKEA